MSTFIIIAILNSQQYYLKPIRASSRFVLIPLGVLRISGTLTAERLGDSQWLLFCEFSLFSLKNTVCKGII